jgi:hypothetical protein
MTTKATAGKNKQEAETPEQRQKRHDKHQVRHMTGKALKDAKHRFGRRGGVTFDPDCLDPSIRCRIGVVDSVKLSATDSVRSLRVKGAGATWSDAFRDASRQEHDDLQRQKDRELKRAEKQKAAA